MPIDVTLSPSADSTGVNNATPYVQDAINQLKAAGGGRLFIPPGTFRLNSSGVVEDSAPLGIKGLRVAVKIDSGNIEILAQNPANPPLFFTDETFTSPVNSTILFLFYVPSGGSAFGQLKLTHLKFRGPQLTSADQFPPGDACYGLVVFFGKAWNQRFTDITVQYCTFTDPVRYAIDFEYCSQVSVTTCSFQMYDRYAYNDLFPDTILPAIIVALFAAQNGIEHATVDSCFFNGRVKSEVGIYNPAQPYQTRFGADGFVFFQKGGHITLTNNTLRRYYLEGVQTNAGPAYVNYNTFETPFSTGVAYMAYADTGNTTPGATPYILQRLYHFKHNTVNGGSVGVKFAGISYPPSSVPTLAPQITGVVENNTSIRLNPPHQVVPGSAPVGVFAGGADLVTLRNNQFYHCSRMFQTGIDQIPQANHPLTNFNCREVVIESNILHAFAPAGSVGGSMDAIFLQFPLRKDEMATIGKNTLARGNANYAHIKLTGTNMVKVSGQIEAGKAYKVFVPTGGNPTTDKVIYNGVQYAHGQQFTGVAGVTTFAVTSGSPQVRFAASAPWNYLAKIGDPDGANKNTYITYDPPSGTRADRFIYYSPGDNDVLQAPATPSDSPKDGVSVQYY